MAAPSTYINPLLFMEDFLDSVREMGELNVKEFEVITPEVTLLTPATDGEYIMRFLESAIRTAYKSEDKIGPGSHEKVISHILSLKHESTLEHFSLSFRIITSRGVTHELVRHRIASFTQESTRYVNYSKRPPQAILPWHLTQMDRAERVFWANGIKGSIRSYQEALAREWKPQEARGFLPNDLKTEIVVTMNLRSLLNFFKLRTAPSAHPDMQVIARKMLDITWGLLPLIFADNMDTVSAQWPVAAQEKP